MPRSFRRPPGTYARGTPDWFAMQGSGACGFITAGATTFGSVSLFNDDNAGRPLFVHGLYVVITGNSLVDMQAVHGPVGARVNLGGPLYTPYGPAFYPGQIYAGNNATQQLGRDMGHIGIVNGSQFWPYAFPVAIVAAGWSFVLIADQVNIAITASFWWFIDDDLK